jgi:hypothetical protein
VIGAQAIYMHTGGAAVGLAETTKDSDLALDTRSLSNVPLLESAMIAAGFRRDPHSAQPGSWLNPEGIPVDLMVPESLAGGSGRHRARIPPHSKHAARRAAGLEAALIDNAPILVTPLDSRDGRAYTANVAGPAALLVAKLHKLGERQSTPGRLVERTHMTSTAYLSPPVPTTLPTRCSSSRTIPSLVRPPTKPSPTSRTSLRQGPVRLAP